MTQADRVVDFMQKNGSISSLEAIQELGVTRLAACIYKLKRNGLEIAKETAKSVNRYGEKVYFARYRIV